MEKFTQMLNDVGSFFTLVRLPGLLSARPFSF